MPDKFTLRLDSSQMVLALKCPTAHDFAYVQNLSRKREDKVAMDRGTVMHGLLERYYHGIWRNLGPSEAMNFAVNGLNELKKQVHLQDDDYKLLGMRFMEYCMKYRNDKIEIATIDTPQGKKPALEVGFSVVLIDNDMFYFVLEGRIDMITVMSGHNVVWDHKAQGRSYFLFGHSVQCLNYTLVSNTNMFMHNYVRLHQKVQPNTFDRKLNYMERWLQIRWKKKVIDYFYKIASSRMEGRFVDKDFPQPACADIGYGKKCPFTEVCSEFDIGRRNAIINLNYMPRKAWEPWSFDEIGLEIE